MALYKVEKTYYVEADSDFEAFQAATEQGIANKIVIELATEAEAQELKEIEEASEQFLCEEGILEGEQA